MAEEERDKTRRLSDLVTPLREGSLGAASGYTEAIKTLRFLLLDKRNRPFLILTETKFDGPQLSPAGTMWPHSITVVIQNISDTPACKVTGYASILLDKQAVEPIFLFDEFTVDRGEGHIRAVLLSEEIHAKATDPTHTLNLIVSVEYNGIVAEARYRSQAWVFYDPVAQSFREHLTHS
jgi:hypothetical protein